MEQKELKIALVLPALKMGGMERVMAELANYFEQKPNTKICLILLGKLPRFYEIPASVEIIEPGFDYRKYSRPVFTLKIFLYLHRTIKKQNPGTLLSFSERYNAFVMLAAWGKHTRVFLSDRASPLYSAGKLIDLINPYVYRLADGIVAQTAVAKQMLFKKTKHKNITVIGNPVKPFTASPVEKKNIILYVGRFSDQKNQHLLAQYFSAINNINWVVKLVGDGPKELETRKKVEAVALSSYIHFEGSQKDIAAYYNRSAIFAFTSLSEGFPNALAEAMAAGLACISYDCIAGPADVIDDGINGFLIPVGNDSLYIEKLKLLMEDAALRKQFGEKAKEKMKNFESNMIAEKFYQFITAPVLT